jgi:hypothetical protein
VVIFEIAIFWVVTTDAFKVDFDPEKGGRMYLPTYKAI